MKRQRHKSQAEQLYQAELHDRLEQVGFWRPFAEFDEQQPRADIEPVNDDDHRRRHELETDRHRRKFQAEYKAGKQARSRGQRRTSNPYAKRSLSAELWAEGFDAARECDRSKQKYRH